MTVSPQIALNLADPETPDLGAGPGLLELEMFERPHISSTVAPGEAIGAERKLPSAQRCRSLLFDERRGFDYSHRHPETLGLDRADHLSGGLG
ncbi:hypothetical protein [Nocardia aurea]|uniref:hypothetical protein n=1 Tax=Nocardia aurea TaxID=2144174 RepID=UPI000D694861|nr:hypothetical protein [Nocardia aurea]